MARPQGVVRPDPGPGHCRAAVAGLLSRSNWAATCAGRQPAHLGRLMPAGAIHPGGKTGGQLEGRAAGGSTGGSTDWVWPNPPSRTVGDDQAAAGNSPVSRKTPPGPPRFSASHRSAWNSVAQRPWAPSRRCRGCYAQAPVPRAVLGGASKGEAARITAPASSAGQEASTGSPPFQRRASVPPLTSLGVSVPKEASEAAANSPVLLDEVNRRVWLF